MSDQTGDDVAPGSAEPSGFIPQSEWTLRRYREDQAEIPAEFTDQELLRAITAYTRLAAVHTKATKVAAQWAAIGVWIVVLAVLAALLGLITLEFQPL